MLAIFGHLRLMWTFAWLSCHDITLSQTLVSQSANCYFNHACCMWYSYTPTHCFNLKKNLQNTELTYELSRIGSSGFRRIKLKQNITRNLWKQKQNKKHSIFSAHLQSFSGRGNKHTIYNLYRRISLFCSFQFHRKSSGSSKWLK